MRQIAKTFAQRPLISVMMATYNTPARFLRKAIDSVLAQTYDNWELCIADDASPLTHMREILNEYAQLDTRIKVTIGEKSGRISAASNSALAVATGEFTGLLAHHDELAEHALYCVVEAINADPNAGIIYSDEDKIDESGKRCHPYFKSDWNYDLFLSHNMICHFGCYRTELLHRVGGFRLGFEGSPNYDLALRCIEQLQPSQIVHIPRILYRRRMHAGSTAGHVESKSYAVTAAQNAIREHLQRCGISADVGPAPEAPAMQRVKYNLATPLPRVTLIIPTRNREDLLRTCIESLFATTKYDTFDVIIVDNDSDEAATLSYLAQLSSRPRIRIVRDSGPFNFSRLNNNAAHLAEGEVLGLLNNDLEFKEPRWLEEMVSHATRPGVGVVGARLLYPDGSLQHGGIVLGIGGVAGHIHKHVPRGHAGYIGRAVLVQSLSAVTGACCVVRKVIFDEVGGMDEDLAVAFNDVDFCIRVRQRGYRNLWTPYAEVIHHESASRGKDTTWEKAAHLASEVRFMQNRWGRALETDPAYNPNLTLDREDLSYAWPPRVPKLTAE
jgi:GT2 family glycosyltransferase